MIQWREQFAQFKTWEHGNASIRIWTPADQTLAGAGFDHDYVVNI
jgi:hypothetical protein